MLLGLATLSVSGDADFEINTPAAAFNTLREGVYRFDVVENGNTDAIVRKGALEAANNEFSKRLRAGDLLHVSPGDRNPQMSLYDKRDAWDEWNDRRNADLRVEGNQRYLPDNVYVGSSELYRYGRWINVESYGTAWIPYAVDAAWTPYSTGRWCYRPFFGWTWVSYEPWGWLPYHYGRWYRNSRYGWCWLPGPAYSFNFWSPALVTFYSGPGWVSWCPLGPGDYYDIRNYHYNHGIFRNQLADMQRLHNRPVGDPFNRQVPGAFRTAQLERFRDGSFDNQTRNTRWGNIDRPWSQGTLVQDRLAIRPSEKSFSAVTDRIAVRPSASSVRAVVVRTVPERDFDNRERFARITNPQIPSIQPRSVRVGESEGDMGNRGISRQNARVIQTPGTRSEGSPVIQENRRTESPRSSGSRSNSDESVRLGSARTIPETAEPSMRQNSPRQRNERTIPEQRIIPQRAPEASPRSEPRRESNVSERQSGANLRTERLPQAGGARAYSAPGSNDGGHPSRAPEIRSAPSYSPPPSNSGERRGNAPVMRAPDSGRSPSYSAPAPRPSGPVDGGSRTSSAPPRSQENSGGNSRSSSDGNSGRHR
jgi:hypothetical protein